MTTKRVCTKCEVNRISTQFTSERARVCNPCKKLSTRRSAKAARLWKLYGITIEEYEAILALQGGVCAGCGQKRSYPLHVDHDHAVERALLAQGLEPHLAARGSVRGLLCRKDNKVLRDVRDNASNLRQLADYITFPPAKELLNA